MGSAISTFFWAVCLALGQIVFLEGASAQEAPPAVIEPHVQTQRLLAEVLRPAPNVDEAQLRRKLEELTALIRTDVPRFVQQSVLYEANERGKREPFSTGFTSGLFQNAGIDERDFPDAISTLLYCNDEHIRKEAWKLLRRSITRECVNGQPDLSHFRDHVIGQFQKPAIAQPLRRAIFESVPSAAFLLFHSGAERTEWIPYRHKERIVSNALYEKQWLGGIPGGKVNAETAATLRDLAASKYWWARMFVAEIMVQNKEFRDADVIKRLLEDENELVRNSVASIEKPDPLRAAKVDD